MVDVHPVARFVTVQVAVVLLGVFCTGMMLKVNGYPDLDFWPVTVRNCGMLFLTVPAGWAYWAMRSENNVHSRWTSRWTVVSGLLMIAGLGFFFYCSSMRALFPPVGPTPIGNMGS